MNTQMQNKTFHSFLSSSILQIATIMQCFFPVQKRTSRQEKERGRTYSFPSPLGCLIAHWRYPVKFSSLSFLNAMLFEGQPGDCASVEAERNPLKSFNCCLECPFSGMWDMVECESGTWYCGRVVLSCS